MNNKVIFIALIALSTTTFAVDVGKEAQKKKILESFAQPGMPLPGSGLKLVPRSALALPVEMIKQGEKDIEEFKANGYVNQYINRPRELLTFTDSFVAKEMKRFSGSERDTFTGLSKSTDQIKLAFEFPSLSKNKSLANFTSDFHVLGATPTGGFYKDAGGWSGAAEYFTYKNIGTCDYIVNNMKAANEGIQLAIEDVTYTINNKITILMPVVGSENSGFLYSVKWYDDKSTHELECGNMAYSKEISDAVIELAKKIDSH